MSCRDGSFYVGSTVDLERRLWEHQVGLGAAYTRRRRPVELVWCEEHERVDAAYAREKQVQGWSRAKRQALVDGRYADLPRLAEGHWRRGR
nr:GIY-YIG nuclease family protein [Nocardioides perillae]